MLVALDHLLVTIHGVLPSLEAFLFGVPIAAILDNAYISL